MKPVLLSCMLWTLALIPVLPQSTWACEPASIEERFLFVADKNNDDVIDKQEWQQANQYDYEVDFEVANSEQNFNKLDVNHNQTLELEELYNSFIISYKEDPCDFWQQQTSAQPKQKWYSFFFRLFE